jgi:hypothetical protein
MSRKNNDSITPMRNELTIEYIKNYRASKKYYVNDTHITFVHNNKKVTIIIYGQYTDDPYDGNYYNGKYFSLIIDGNEIIGDTDESLRNFVSSSKTYINDELFKKLTNIANKITIYPITQFNVSIN